MGLFLLLVADVAYVAYCIVCNKLETEDDVRLVWLSAIVWFVILVKILRRLIRLGKLRGGCFSPFASLGEGLSRCWNGFKRGVHKPWESMWDRIEPEEGRQKRRKKVVLTM